MKYKKNLSNNYQFKIKSSGKILSILKNESNYWNQEVIKFKFKNWKIKGLMYFKTYYSKNQSSIK